MNINATFLIQITNFWITYLFLHKLLFKPVVALLKQRAFAKNSMLEALKGKELTLVQLQEKKSQHLVAFRQQMHATYNTEISPLNYAPIEIEYHHDQQAIEALVNESKDLMIKRIDDVCSRPTT